MHKLRSLGTGAALLLWGSVLSVVCSVLMVGHWVTLPMPEPNDAHLRRSIASILPPSDGQWHLVHVLYSKCRCSQRIFDYLFRRQKPLGALETVLLVEPVPTYAERARRAGFDVQQIEPEHLQSRFNIESAPLLLIVDPNGLIRYSGGYTSRKQGLDYKDLELLATLRQAEQADALPLYGCGTSRELQNYLDPIGVKYAR